MASRVVALAALLALTLAARPVQDTQQGDPTVSEIDRYFEQYWRDNDLRPSDIAGDAEFLRRVWLDIAGTIPTADQAREFLADRSRDKRAALIDRLLETDEYAMYWGANWLTVLRNDEPFNGPEAQLFLGLFPWLMEQIDANRPWNEMVADMVDASGTGEEAPQIGYLGHMLTNRNEGAMDAMQAVSAHFLGIAISCARCHDHPFSSWLQREYYEWSAYMINTGVRVQREYNDPNNPQRPTFHFQMGDVVDRRGRRQQRDLTYPDSEEPVRPRYLGSPEFDGSTDRRRSLAAQLTADPQFARALVNRYWGILFGRGIVHPADGFMDNNQPAHPELLDLLGQRFEQNGFDLKWLMRTICNTQVYQRSCSMPRGVELPDERNCSHARMRPLMPTQVAMSFLQALGGMEALERLGGNRRDRQGGGQMDMPTQEGAEPASGPVALYQRLQFALRAIGAQSARGGGSTFEVNPDDLQAYKVSLQQVLLLMNQRQLQGLLERRVAQIAQEQREPEAALEELYFTFLSRPPDEQESAAILRFVQQATPRNGGNGGRGRAALEPWVDVAWALMNSSEFTLNH